MDPFQGEAMNHYPRRALIMLACLFVMSCGTELLAQKGGVLKVVNVEGRSARSMSSAGVLAGDTLYVAGQNGRSSYVQVSPGSKF
jgi:hypothetical protein